jgi:hypothetical protein
MGSETEQQDFFANWAKPPNRFWDRTSGRLMAARGWIAEWLLSGSRKVTRHLDLSEASAVLRSPIVTFGSHEGTAK